MCGVSRTETGLLHILCVVGALLAASSAPAEDAANRDFGGALCGLVFNLPEEPRPLDAATLPAELKLRVERYQRRAAAFRSRLRAQKEKGFVPEVLREKRQHIERAMVALVDAPGVERLAADYASQAVLFYEWEGDSGPPLAEAAWAEEYLRKNPHAPLGPYVHLFLAHRYRCAFEAASRVGSAADRDRAAAGYTRALALASSDSDPLVRAIARDMDRLPHLYLENSAHP